MDVVIETPTHLIEVSENCLTIGTFRFPDDYVSLTPEETEAVLKALLLWKYGTDEVVPASEISPN